MAVIINDVSSSTFSLNGKEYSKIFQPLDAGANSIAIYNAYDTRYQLLRATDYTEFTIDGTTYASQALTLGAISNVVFAIETGGGGGGGDVTSVFGRTGAVGAVVSDYSAFYSQIGHTHTTSDITDLSSYTGFDARYYTEAEADSLLAAKLNSSSYTAADVFSKVLTQDGSGSGLDADLLDGVQGTSFVRSDATDTVSGILTFTAIPAFNGGTSGSTSPFTVDSTQVVSNLNADLVDGLQASSFVRADAADVKTGNLAFNGASANLIMALGDIRLTDNTAGTGGMWLSHTGTNGFVTVYDGTLKFQNNGGTQSMVFDPATGNVDITGEYLIDGASFGSNFVSATADDVKAGDLAMNAGASIVMATSYVKFTDNTTGTNGTWIRSTGTNTFWTMLDEDIIIQNNGGSNQINIDFTTVDMTSDGDITATDFILSSDERLKENIQDLMYTHVPINWKTFEMDGKKKVGVVAQDVMQYRPEYVKERKDGYLSVNYIALLCEKVAELEARLEALGA